MILTEYNGYKVGDCIKVNGYPNTQTIEKIEECQGCGGRKTGKVKFTINDSIINRKRVIWFVQIQQKCE